MVRVSPDLHRELSDILMAGGIEDALLEATWILEDAADESAAREIAMQRAKHMPLQYLLGKWEFYGLPFYVGEGVLIPRADTETLVDVALECLTMPAPKVLDLCTGSGCIAIAIQVHRRDAVVYGMDVDETALGYARRNGTLNGVDIPFRQGDVLAADTSGLYQNLDLIVSNPPYLTEADLMALQPEVTYEPRCALDGGQDGLRFYRGIAAGWKHCLRDGGMLAFEVGMGQAEDVAALMAAEGFTDIQTRRDLSGIQRVILGRYIISE